jgi:hypothetical protein
MFDPNHIIAFFDETPDWTVSDFLILSILSVDNGPNSICLREDKVIHQMIRLGVIVLFRSLRIDDSL